MNQVSHPVQSTFRINRRVHHRYAMVQREGFLHAGDEKVPCVVRNISSGGLLARIYRQVELGDCVRIELAGGQLLEGTILWARDWEVGVAFRDTVEVEPILAEQWVTEADGDRRKSHRVEIECPATLQVRLRFYYGKLCDLSPTGAKVRTQGPLKKTGDAILSLPDLGPIPAVIRWANGRECGLSFKESIPSEALTRWLEDRGFAALEEPAAQIR